MTESEKATVNKDFFEFLICAAIQHGDITVRRGATELGIEYDEMMALMRRDCERRAGK